MSNRQLRVFTRGKLSGRKASGTTGRWSEAATNTHSAVRGPREKSDVELGSQNEADQLSLIGLPCFPPLLSISAMGVPVPPSASQSLTVTGTSFRLKRNTSFPQFSQFSTDLFDGVVWRSWMVTDECVLNR